MERQRPTPLGTARFATQDILMMAQIIPRLRDHKKERDVRREPGETNLFYEETITLNAEVNS